MTWQVAFIHMSQPLTVV